MYERRNNPDRNDNDAKDEEQRLQSQYCVEDRIELVDNGPPRIKYSNELCSTFDATFVPSNHTIVQVLSCIHRVFSNVVLIIVIAYSRLTQFCLLVSQSLFLLLSFPNLIICEICSRTGVIGRPLLPARYCMSDSLIIVNTD